MTMASDGMVAEAILGLQYRREFGVMLRGRGNFVVGCRFEKDRINFRGACFL